MRALLDDDETLIAETGARLTRGGRKRARAVLNGGEPKDEPGSSLNSGWLGLGIPESLGGSGGSLVSAALLLQELGRSLEPTSFGSRFVAHHALAAAGFGNDLLAGRDVAVELGERVHIEGSRVRGTIGAVPGASAGCAVLCVASDGRLVLAEAGAADTVQGVDALRPCARVTIDGAPIAIGPAHDAAATTGAALVAAELCGVGRGALDLAVQFARDRVQFGRPIGSFQAIAHRLAEASAQVEAAWSLVLYACSSIEAGTPDRIRAAHAAKACSGDAALFAADACIQTHGGMGITYDADPHLFLRRALFCDSWFGAAPAHRRRLGELALRAR